MPERVRWAVIVLLGALAFGLPSSGFTAEPPSLDELLKQYKELGLPFPPKEAKLVRYQDGWEDGVNGKIRPKGYSLAFEIKPESKTEHAELRIGLSRAFHLRGWDIRPVKPESAAANNVDIPSMDDW